MKGNYYNKILHIGPGGINCGCCVNYPKKRHNHKHRYSKLRRRIMKQLFYKELRIKD